MRVPKAWFQLPMLFAAAELYGFDVCTIDNVLGAAGGTHLFKTHATVKKPTIYLKMTYEKHYKLLMKAEHKH